MATVTKSDIETMDFCYQAEPFVNVVSKDTIDTTGLEYVYQAEPFYGLTGSITPPVSTAFDFILMSTLF